MPLRLKPDIAKPASTPRGFSKAPSPAISPQPQGAGDGRERGGRAVTITMPVASGVAMGRDVSCQVGRVSLRVIAGHRDPLWRRKGGTYPLSHLYGHFKLVRLCRLGHDVPWVKA
jgi:hypothetical protein